MIPQSPFTAFEIASKWLQSFEKASHDVAHKPGDASLDAFMALLLPNAFWRDSLCLSWDLRTKEGAASIRDFLQDNGRLVKANLHGFEIDTSSALGDPVRKTLPYEKAVLHEVVEFTFYFRIGGLPGRGRGIVRLLRAPKSEEWKAYLIYSVLQSIDGHEPNDEPAYGHYEGHTKSWEDVRAEELAEIEKDPTVVVIGGGTGGLMMASRLRDVGLKVLVIERNAQVGDTWRERYDLLTLNVSNGSNCCCTKILTIPIDAKQSAYS